MSSPSTMILEELLDAGDPRFWDELMKLREPRATKTLPPSKWSKVPTTVPIESGEKLPRSRLAAFADKWIAHPSPFARRMLLRYVDDGLDRRGQRPLVRQLIRRAEEKDDRALLAHALVALDRSVKLVKRPRYDYRTRTTVTVVVRVRPRAREMRRSGETYPYPLAFSSRTRSYLRRRLLRAFRLIGYRDPTRYLREALEALALYEDAHLDTPEKLVASWSLLRILHAGSPVIENDGRRIAVRVGRQLGELTPAPMHPEAWAQGFDAIFAALPRLRALFVRRQVALHLEKVHADALAALPLEKLRPLLASTYADLASLGARLVATSKGAETLPVAEWLSLLEIDDPTAVAAVIDRMEKLVAPTRVSLADVVRLVRTKHARAAALGVALLADRKLTQPAELDAAMSLVDAPVGTARAAALRWLTPFVASAGLGRETHVRDLLDARFDDARAAGMALVESEERFRDAALLWQAASESPYADVRSFLLRHLDARAGALTRESLARVWATTLLAVHRGSRDKQRALVLVGTRLGDAPDEADSLLALLALSLRSVRETERRGAIAAAVRSAARVPALREKLVRALPELRVTFPESLTLPAPAAPRRALSASRRPA